MHRRQHHNANLMQFCLPQDVLLHDGLETGHVPEVEEGEADLTEANNASLLMKRAQSYQDISKDTVGLF